MRDLRDCSGPWVGFFLQYGIRGSMRLNLRFSGTIVSGDGSDFVGPFTFDGKYHPGSERVEGVKRYSSHRVEYKGTWDGAMIAGTWRIKTLLSREKLEGEFEIWPEREEESIEQQLEVEAKPNLQPVGV